MATYRLSLSTVKRSTGRSVVAAVAYQHAARLEQGEGKAFYGGRAVHDYSKKAGVLDSYLLVPRGAPAWAHDREALWNAAEAAENRKNSVTGREIILSLPHELGLAEHQIMTRRFAERLVRRYSVAVDIAIHAPSKDGDQRNIHAHLMMTTRALGSDGFGDKTRVLDENRAMLMVDQNRNPMLDAEGKRKYQRARGPQEVIWMREEWAGIENHFLVERGIAAVDHRSLETQGVDRDPEPKLGVAAKAMERRGLKTERGASVREWESQRAAKVERVAVPEQAAANDSPARLGIEKPRHAQTRLEREAEQLESWRTQKLSQLSARQSDDWDTLQARQASQTAAHTTQMQEAHGQYRADQLAQIQALTERLQANGVRRLVGRVSGAQAADREALAALRATVRNGRWRERVATQALCQEQESERAQRLAEHRAQFDAFKETIAGIRGLHGAKRFDQAERSRLVVQGNEAALARFDRENPGVAPAVSVALAAERRAGLSGQFESSADMERGDRDHVRDPGQDFGLDR